ncbi:alpha/beta fold hydrolase [Lysinibacillus sp. NPDC056185]|uniref:alpha/beta fold hydrolase n=1 Tax=Lysinibacillus sp. NPDC056185 TaxID=3345739 RepID=UPI0039EE5AEA
MKNYIQYNAFQNKEVIIAIPALGERKEMYAALASILPEAHIVAIDLPGHNGQLDNDFSFQSYNNTIKEIMEYLKITKAHFLGNSIGAWIIQNFYTNYPDSVKSLTLLDGGYYFIGEYHPDDKAEIQLPIIERLEDLQEAINEEIRNMGNLSAENKEYLYNYFLHNFVEKNNVYYHHSDANALNDLSKAVEKNNYCIENEISLSVLLLLADEHSDSLLHKKLNRFQKRQPNAQVEIIPKSYHFLPLTNPNEIAARIRKAILH